MQNRQNQKLAEQTLTGKTVLRSHLNRLHQVQPQELPTTGDVEGQLLEEL
jgi:hypothetical protein